MDQNHFQYEAGYTPFRVKKTAADYRARAREALKPSFWIAVLACFVASILGGADSSVGGGFSVSVSREDLNSAINLLRQGDLDAIMSQNPLIPIVLGVTASVAVFVLLFRLFVGAPVTLGYQRFNLDLIDGKPAMVTTLFEYFKGCFGKSVLLRLVYDAIMTLIGLPLAALSLALLWVNRGAALRILEGTQTAGDVGALLLVGFLISIAAFATMALQIWMQYRYAFCFMILAEYPEIGVLDALRNSAALMKGNKWRYFCLNLSFIGWILLGALVTTCTCGLGAIGLYALMPYINAASAAFYDDVANRKAGDEVEFPSIDPDDYAAE